MKKKKSKILRKAETMEEILRVKKGPIERKGQNERPVFQIRDPQLKRTFHILVHVVYISFEALLKSRYNRGGGGGGGKARTRENEA